MPEAPDAADAGTTAPAATEPEDQQRTWDPVKFQQAFAGRRLISFDELYKYYRYDGVKSRIASLQYDPWDGVKIALVLTGLMLLIAVCMAACHYRDNSRRRRLSRQAAEADAEPAADEVDEGAAVQVVEAVKNSTALTPPAAPPAAQCDQEAARPLRSESSPKPRKPSESVVKVHFHRSQCFDA